MTMLNEEIVKEMSKYDDMFNGFSYNDIIPEDLEEVEQLVEKFISKDVISTETNDGGQSLAGVIDSRDLAKDSPKKLESDQALSPSGHKDEESSSDSEKEEEKVKNEILKHQASLEISKLKDVNDQKSPVKESELDPTKNSGAELSPEQKKGLSDTKKNDSEPVNTDTA